jgi:hypothetical protein
MHHVMEHAAVCLQSSGTYDKAHVEESGGASVVWLPLGSLPAVAVTDSSRGFTIGLYKSLLGTA